MESHHASDVPEFPKLRPIATEWVVHEGQRYLHLRDHLGLSGRTILVPQPLALLLALCDGTRNVSGLQAGFMLRTGVPLSSSAIRDLLTQLDAALFLENGAYRTAVDRTLKEYRDAGCRQASHAGQVYPADAVELANVLLAYTNEVSLDQVAQPPGATLAGIVCPHIDYARGHKTYAELWQRAAPELEDVELAIIFGTDHSGGPGMLTPTRQDYATPFGSLPTEKAIVDGLADALGPDAAFSEEIHHINEHSIELASVWFHYFIGGRACPIVPILCGTFQHFVMGDGTPEDDEAINAALAVLREAAAGRKALVIAAADLAHVGPAFGDPAPLDPVARARLAAQDGESIAAICDGDAAAFFRCSQRESDSRRICGLPPIYMALRYLENVRGESLGYDQCLADVQGNSVVSIVGALLYEDS